MSSVRICLYTHQPMSIELSSTAGAYVAELILAGLSRSERYWLPHSLRQELQQAERGMYPRYGGLVPTEAEARAGAVLHLIDRGYRACVIWEPSR